MSREGSDGGICELRYLQIDVPKMRHVAQSLTNLGGIRLSQLVPEGEVDVIERPFNGIMCFVQPEGELR